MLPTEKPIERGKSQTMNTLELETSPTEPTQQDLAAERAAANESIRSLGDKELSVLRTLSHVMSVLGLLAVVAVVVTGAFLFNPTPSTNIPLIVGALLVSLLAAFAYQVRPSWGRAMGFVHCATLIPTMVVLAVVGVLGMLVLLKSGRLFGSAKFPHKELEAEWMRRKKG